MIKWQNHLQVRKNLLQAGKNLLQAGKNLLQAGKNHLYQTPRWSRRRLLFIGRCPTTNMTMGSDLKTSHETKVTRQSYHRLLL
jgi:hypothetical protein